MGSVCKAIGSSALLIALCSMPALAATLSFWDFNDSNLTVDAGSGTLTTSFPGLIWRLDRRRDISSPSTPAPWARSVPPIS